MPDAQSPSNRSSFGRFVEQQERDPEMRSTLSEARRHYGVQWVGQKHFAPSNGYRRIRLERGLVTWTAYLVDDPSTMTQCGPFYAWTRAGAIKKAHRWLEQQRQHPRVEYVDVA